MPVLAGDPVAALARPDTVVMARGIARRLFGEDAPLGKTLEVVNGSQVVTLTVGAQQGTLLLSTIRRPPSG